MKNILLVLTTLIFTNIVLAQNKNNSLIKSSVTEITVQKDSIKKNLKKVISTSQTQTSDILKSPTTQIEKLQQTIPSNIPINERVVIEKFTQKLPSVNTIGEKIKQEVPNQNTTKKVYHITTNVMNGTLVNSVVPKKLEEGINKLQPNALKKIWDRTVYSFDIALGLGQNSNLLRITPAVGVRITQYYTLGLGMPIQYTNFSQNINQKGFEDFMYGVKVYHRLHLPKGIYLQVDGDLLNNGLSENQVRRWVPAMWTGFGYNKKLTKHFGASIMVMYNPLYKENYTPYSLPIDIRVGFNWYQPTKPIIGSN
jgi:hypothetical protein